MLKNNYMEGKENLTNEDQQLKVASNNSLQNITNSVQSKQNQVQNQVSQSVDYQKNNENLKTLILIQELYSQVKDQLDQGSYDYLKQHIPLENDKQNLKNINVLVQNMKVIFSYVMKAKTDIEEVLENKNDNECSEYEQLLQKSEAEIRQHIKIQTQLKIYTESTQEKLDNVMKENDQMKEEMKEVQKKYDECKKMNVQLLEQKRQKDQEIEEIKIKQQKQTEKLLQQQQSQQIIKSSLSNSNNNSKVQYTSHQNFKMPPQPNSNNNDLNYQFSSNQSKNLHNQSVNFQEDRIKQVKNNMIPHEQISLNTTNPNQGNRTKRSMTSNNQQSTSNNNIDTKNIKSLQQDIKNMHKTLNQNSEKLNQNHNKSYNNAKDSKDMYRKHSNTINHSGKPQPNNNKTQPDICNKEYIKNSVKGFEDKLRKSMDKYNKPQEKQAKTGGNSLNNTNYSLSKQIKNSTQQISSMLQEDRIKQHPSAYVNNNKSKQSSNISSQQNYYYNNKNQNQQQFNSNTNNSHNNSQYQSQKDYVDSERIKNLTKKITSMQNGSTNRTSIDNSKQQQPGMQQNYTRERIQSHHNASQHQKSVHNQSIQHQNNSTQVSMLAQQQLQQQQQQFQMKQQQQQHQQSYQQGLNKIKNPYQTTQTRGDQRSISMDNQKMQQGKQYSQSSAVIQKARPDINNNNNINNNTSLYKTYNKVMNQQQHNYNKYGNKY